MSADPQAQEVLIRQGRELVRAVDRSVARYQTLREEWSVEAAHEARGVLCEVLHGAAGDDEFWNVLRQVTADIEPSAAAQMEGLAVSEFEEFERDLLEWAGVSAGLAASWAASTGTVLRAIREGFAGGYSQAGWVDADRQREHVLLAMERVCGENVPELMPPGVAHDEDVDRQNLKRSKRFRKRLWGGIKVTGGLGQLALNAAVLIGGSPIPGVNIPTTIFGGGSILSGAWTTVSGAESLHEASAED